MITAKIPADWLQNEAYQIHVERTLIDSGIPVVRMDHMTPVLSSGEITSDIIGHSLIYTWLADGEATEPETVPEPTPAPSVEANG